MVVMAAQPENKDEYIKFVDSIVKCDKFLKKEFFRTFQILELSEELNNQVYTRNIRSNKAIFSFDKMPKKILW